MNDQTEPFHTDKEGISGSHPDGKKLKRNLNGYGSDPVEDRINL